MMDQGGNNRIVQADFLSFDEKISFSSISINLAAHVLFFDIEAGYSLKLPKQ